MGATMIEKILALHSGQAIVNPGDITDVKIDLRAARDFGGANVVQHLKNHRLDIADPSKTFFTFDCNPTGSDQKYATNQHLCRLFARENGVKIYDIDSGIGTHLMIDQGMVWPGATAVSTDSHANILGAIGAFGQGMGDMDIAVAWSKGKVWFKTPPSAKVILQGAFPDGLTAKDIILNLLSRFGANELLGYAVEVTGEAIKMLSLDARITISSMATEMGAIILFFSPDEAIVRYAADRSGVHFQPVFADPDAHYDKEFTIDVSCFKTMVSRPGKPDDAVDINEVRHRKIDSAFIGSCTNGRMEDMRAAASVLKGRKIAPGVVLKIVPSTARIWDTCLKEGLLGIFYDAGALVSNPGCAGCAAGQVGQNGPGEVTVSTGNRNFPGKQGKGDVFLASPAVAAASAVAGFITTPDDIPDIPAEFPKANLLVSEKPVEKATQPAQNRPGTVEGRAWVIEKNDIDTDMIFHNSHLTITDIKEMGQYTFGNLKGFEDFASKAKAGDIIVTGRNFGAGSSRQQAVDCFISLGIQCILAESFGAIYERNAINAAFPVMICKSLKNLHIQTGDILSIDFKTGTITNRSKKLSVSGEKFSDVQMNIYLNGGIF